MTIIKNFLVLIFLFAVLFVNNSNANAKTTEIYLISFKGSAPAEKKISVDIALKASLFDPSCQKVVRFQGQNSIEAHIYTVRSNTISDYKGVFDIDIDLNRLLKEKIEQAVMNSEIDLNISSVQFYIKKCKFQVYMLTINSSYSTLIVRNSIFINLKSSFVVPNNQLKTVDYSFSGINKLFFKIDFLN